ncbi:MAG TPA: ComEC/Rec2 family competence protein [Thermotogota bacterium]|nr:ComEC/Rec2 family competence protein [Thermotogota bacterium]HPJ88522.1 ComEC/Rec2 family competence protein [Thermotogota bacterium]HPR96456.1 ComEC/Rec2 family competence protein [Thermotogota bacterium]
MTIPNNKSSSLNSIPLFLLFTGFFSGILFAQSFLFNRGFLIVVLLVFSASLIFFSWINLLKRRQMVFFFVCLFFLGGILLYKPFYELEEGKCTITARIGKVTDSSIRLNDVSFLSDGTWYETFGEFYLFLPENASVREMDYIALNGTNSKSGHLNFIRVFLDGDYFSHPYAPGVITKIMQYFDGYANTFVSFIRNAIGESNGSFASGMFLGLGMDKATRSMINASGISYLFVVSGFHFFITYFIFSYILSFFKTGTRMTIFIKMLFLILFYLICATGPASFRAFLMLFLYQLFKWFDYPISPLNVIGLSGIIILFTDPSLALNAGFQMTFGAVIGILVLNQLLQNQNQLIKKTSVLGSLFFIIPITAINFRTIPFLSIPLGFVMSLTIIPLIIICMMLVLLSYALNMHFLATIILKGLTPLLDFSRFITEFLSDHLGTLAVEGPVRILVIVLSFVISAVCIFLAIQIKKRKAISSR